MTFEERKCLAKIAAAEAAKIRRKSSVGMTSPVDPVDLALGNECEVIFKSLPTLEGIYSPAPKPTIMLGSERPYGRRSFNCAHEFGHHVLKHGFQIDKLKSQTKSCKKLPEEYSADIFAGCLLMPQMLVRKALHDRRINPDLLTPEQVFVLASFFGVGYETLITHFTWTLGVLKQEQADELRKVKPKQIKCKYGVDAKDELFFVDYYWRHRAVNLEVGDTLALPVNVMVDSNDRLEVLTEREGFLLCRAEASGISRAYDEKNSWAVNVRISKKSYAGFAEYRFIEEPEDD